IENPLGGYGKTLSQVIIGLKTVKGTLPYTLEDIRAIVQIRAKTEGLTLSEEALNHLAESGIRTSLRYVIQLLTPASILARINGRENITLEDIKEVDDLFYDAKSSAKVLTEYQ
ncbi:32760_t:CDS:2, partial [Racocetra persica]